MLLPKKLSFVSSNSRTKEHPQALTISKLWDVLGPFQIGTREAPWGADPLEHIGGFRNLHPTKTSFPSSLAPEGLSTWSQQVLDVTEINDDAIEVTGSFKFPQVDWHSLQLVFGWSALQYQGWARTVICCNAPETLNVAIFIEGIIEFWIDEHHFFGGDLFGNRNAPSMVSLNPGKHRFDIRLTRDVRAMGGTGPPDYPVSLRIDICSDALLALTSKLIVPELVKDRGFPSSYCSIPLVNTGQEDILIQDIEALDDHFNVSLLEYTKTCIVPGQTRPLKFCIEQNLTGSLKLRLVIAYSIGISEQMHKLNLDGSIVCREINQPIRSTFLHPSGIVSYCVIVAPKEQNQTETPPDQPLPVLLNLHGAGLEADSCQVRHQMDLAFPVAAWTVFPTGVTPWSSDDWHTWGFADITAAIDSLSTWMANLKWNRPRLDPHQWYVVGHSNGGQGTWFILTHKPDQVAAAAPVSGYTSIQAYVSYNLWLEMNPGIWMCIQAALNSYRHELLLPNITGIPVLGQHGSADDNVPPYHSRRMHQLLDGLKHPMNYNELKGKGHWFEGVMTTPALYRFYKDIPKPADSNLVPTKRFRLIAPNSGDMGSRGGIQVDQLSKASCLGYIDAEYLENLNWTLKTSNIYRFHLNVEFWKGRQGNVIIDEQAFKDLTPGVIHHFVQRPIGNWIQAPQLTLESKKERVGRQIGSMDAILRTKGTFRIRYFTSLTLPMALQVSRNLNQYFGADTEITLGLETPLRSHSVSSNLITVVIGDDAAYWTFEHSIRITSDGILIIDRKGDKYHYKAEEGLGMIYLAPLPNEALELRIWGFDSAGLFQATRLVPMLTGTGQPDFVIVGKECPSRGAAGVKALGFLDYDWNISDASYLTGI